MKAQAILFGPYSSTLNHRVNDLDFNHASLVDDDTHITFGFLLQNFLIFPLSIFLSHFFLNYSLKTTQKQIIFCQLFCTPMFFSPINFSLFLSTDAFVNANTKIEIFYRRKRPKRRG